MGDRDRFQNSSPDELDDLLEKFLQCLNSPNGYWVPSKIKEDKGRGIVIEDCCYMRIVIEAMTVDDFIKEMNIWQKYLDLCKNKGYI